MGKGCAFPKIEYRKIRRNRRNVIITKEDIKKVFTMKEAVEAGKKHSSLWWTGKCDSPIRTNIPAPKYDGSFLFMPAYWKESGNLDLEECFTT